MSTTVITNYAHIGSDPAILHGVPIIAGTRTPVRSVAQCYGMGLGIGEIKRSLPHLSESEIFSALAFYFDHQTEIDADIHENESIDYLRSIAPDIRTFESNA